MKKNRMRLTESQLHRVIKESVKRVLRESQWQDEEGGREMPNNVRPIDSYDGEGTPSFGQIGQIENAVMNCNLSQYDIDPLNALCSQDINFRNGFLELLDRASERGNTIVY